jgi:hypothetical protein
MDYINIWLNIITKHCRIWHGQRGSTLQLAKQCSNILTNAPKAPIAIEFQQYYIKIASHISLGIKEGRWGSTPNLPYTNQLSTPLHHKHTYLPNTLLISF